ncbi:MAG: BREX-3 system phosphatase PglZ [Caldilineaceae bacterium]|nr:BREX-3 system phosphatase PglZ [Caldilineaceae bacterium]
MSIKTYQFILVSDPDNVLADESLTADLAARGFRLLHEADPIALRAAWQRAQPVTVEQPLIVITGGPLNALPYDLWQQGQHLELALHTFFPLLDYPTIRQLSPAQRARLGDVYAQHPPATPLSASATVAWLLEKAFGATADALGSPARLLLWLDDYHSRSDPLPALLRQALLHELQNRPVVADWPLADLLADRQRYREFVRLAWSEWVEQRVGEGNEAYSTGALSFAGDAALQDSLPRLLRSGTLEPVQVASTASLPGWSLPALAQDEAGVRRRLFAEGVAAVQAALDGGELRWEAWQTVARRWAQLSLHLYQAGASLETAMRQTHAETQARLDSAFAGWLGSQYTSLAGRRLPTPHHLFHIPGYLDSLRPERLRVALLVLDGLSLAVWQQIRAVWSQRHPDWQMDEQLVLAQIPTITAISRQALISGQRPAHFSESLTHNGREKQGWQRFWEGAGLPASAAEYELLSTRSDTFYPPAVDSRRVQALCLVTPIIDQMVHGATQGVADVHASVALWLHNQDDQRQGAEWLEGLIDHLLSAGYTIALTSDHGHVQAVGVGQPQEGVTVRSRSRRARLYESEQFARSVQSGYPETVLWHGDSLLPEFAWVLMAAGRKAFAAEGEVVVSHGGVCIEEVVVPLVLIGTSDC